MSTPNWTGTDPEKDPSPFKDWGVFAIAISIIVMLIVWLSMSLMGY